jgi:predicted NBD/HSP70 family sugar kinase
MKYFVGVDIGGTTSTIAIGNESRQVVHVSDQFPTYASEGPQATISAIVENTCQGMSGLGMSGLGISGLGISPEDIVAVGLATPGPATLDGVLLKTPNLKAEHWDRFPIRGELEKAFRGRSLDLVVHYIGDGQAAALGEFSLRSGAIDWPGQFTPNAESGNLSSLLMVIVGTGLGGGEIREGRVVRGREGRAGHVGHLLLPAYAFRYDHDRQLQVGNATATVESAVSLTGLAHQLEYRLTLDAWRDHPLNQQPGTARDKAKRLRELADANDPLALELFDDQARALGIALLNVNYLGDYDLLVIGGGVCDLSPAVRTRYRELAEATYRQYALDGFRNLSHFEFSACGDSAPVLGALADAYAHHLPA